MFQHYSKILGARAVAYLNIDIAVQGMKLLGQLMYLLDNLCLSCQEAVSLVGSVLYSEERMSCLRTKQHALHRRDSVML